jgi:Tol biopolymer transport system component
VISSDGGRPLKTFPVAQFGYWYRPPLWTPDGQALVFSANNKHIGNLWRQDLEGGTPRQITFFNTDLIYNYAYSRDGAELYISRGSMQTNTVAIKNLFETVERK